MKTNPLAEELLLPSGLKLKNRLCKSALSEALADKDGQANEKLCRLYRQWADGGFGLVITGNVMVDKGALGEHNNVFIDEGQELAPLKAWAQAAQRGGTAAWVQLNHPGKQAPKGLNAETVAPSALDFSPSLRRFFSKPRELAHEEILAIIEKFALAAKRMQEAGFAGVQMHAAHGYLLSQFLSPLHNQRQDAWGGTAEKRQHMIIETYRAIRAAVGKSFSVGIKVNSADFQKGGLEHEESIALLEKLAAEGIDLIEISGGTYESTAMMGKGSSNAREAYFLDFAQKARQRISVPLLLTGGFRSYAAMADAIGSDAVAMVGLGRLSALEPDAPLRLLQGQDPKQELRPIRTGIGFIDKMSVLELTWYREQLERMGEGKAPKISLSKFGVLLRFGWKFIFGGRALKERY